jgi:hypothetical protein
MTHKVEQYYGGKQKVLYTTDKSHTSGRVELEVDGKKLIFDTCDVFTGDKDTGTLITIPSDAKLIVSGGKLEESDKGTFRMVMLRGRYTATHIGIPNHQGSGILIDVTRT